MGTLGLGDLSLAASETEVSLGTLAEMTGFPLDYIKRELILSDDNDLTVEELRKKVLDYLSTF
jgi:hypothetical protein